MPDIVQRGSKGLIRDINKSRVLSLIHSVGPISRSDIAKLADLQPPTVTQIVTEFIAAGLVREEGVAMSGAVGRRPILLTMNEQSAFSVGVKVASTHLTTALADLSGRLVRFSKAPLRAKSSETVLAKIAEQVDEILAHANVEADRVLGVGVGMPGLVDYATGICRVSSLMGWDGVNVRDELEQLLDMQVYVDNDVNMLTAAEIAFGAGREIRDFLTVTVGAGIGCGIVLRREIYRGAYGGSGELGHTKIGTPYRCGNCGAVGCLETVASEIGIRQRASELLGVEDVSIGEVVTRAREGDEALQALLRNGGAAFGRAVGNLVNLFNPQGVVVTGEGTRMGELFLEPMREAIGAATFSLLGDEFRLLVQEWGDEAWAQGA